MLNALVVDDEVLARGRLRKMLGERVNVVAEAGDGAEALARLDEHDVDVLFLDIQMPELNGFEVLERIDPEKRPVVIFTTAYDTYALKAFEQNAVDYLLKPISRDRLEDAVKRVERLKSTPESKSTFDARLAKLLDWIDNDQIPPATDAAPREVLRQISVPYRDRILLVPAEQLISAEIHDGITRLYVAEEPVSSSKVRIRQHVVNYTLDELETKLDADVFMRVHRSAIIQVDHIRELIPWFSGRYKLVMVGEHEVIASRDRSRVLKDRLML